MPAQLKERKTTSARNCRHHWIIETPHGVTSRGLCKRCGARKRFPNAAEDAAWEPAAGLGRWANRKNAAQPTEIRRPDVSRRKN
jgi:hypothetical protein